ncbi:MAG: chemotaxis protein CheW [Burkholderiaceae bacterium]|nr:MAG: chemotaxis protein CheW [Burkholderiaceae bacterium]MBE7426161.1 chemotaxis protein CheW [Ideonella sp.]MCC7287438.1 chemotaxis protein CheW [Burkholderiaceae bacterium]
MANKEALRELQTRLAQRLQVARNEPATHAWLAVECAGQGLLLPLEQAGEIFNAGRILAVPHTQAWFAGVANLRGGLHGVVDLAAFLGLRARSAQEHGAEGARLVALSPQLGTNSALLVDRLAGLRHENELSGQADEAAASRPAFAGPRWQDKGGRPWQEINLAALAADVQFLAIAA